MERDHRRFAAIPETRDAPRVQGFLEHGAKGTRTPDLLGAIQALSQLSYSPVGGRVQEVPLAP